MISGLNPKNPVLTEPEPAKPETRKIKLIENPTLPEPKSSNPTRPETRESPARSSPNHQKEEIEDLWFLHSLQSISIMH